MPFSIGGVMKAMTKLLETWLVPNKNDVRILELYYLLHPVRACTNRCSCNTTSVLRDLTAIEREDLGDQSPAHRPNTVRKVGDICSRSAIVRETLCT